MIYIFIRSQFRLIATFAFIPIFNVEPLINLERGFQLTSLVSDKRYNGWKLLKDQRKKNFWAEKHSSLEYKDLKCFLKDDFYHIINNNGF